MSHFSTSLIWSELEKRRDASAIVWEALGRVWPAAVCGALDRNSTIYPAVVVCKHTFDLQRIYVEPRVPDTDLNSYLLDPHEIVEILACLVSFVKTFSLNDRPSPDESAGKLLGLIRQAVLSAVRALLLMKRSSVVSTDWSSVVGRLETCFDSWPSHEGIDSSRTRPILRDCQLQLSRSTAPETERGCIHHLELTLPNIGEGRIILDNKAHIIQCVDQASTCIHSNCHNWIRSHWTVSDAQLAMIAASVEFLNQPDSHDETSNVNRRLREISRMRLEVSNIIDRPAKSSYFSITDPQPVCLAGECPCISAEPATEGSSTTFSHAYQILHDRLQKRRRAVFDSEHVLERIESRLVQYLQSWTSSVGDEQLHDSMPIEPDQVPGAAYILLCPKLHPMSDLELLERVKDSARDTGLDDLRDKKDLVSVSIRCPLCEDGQRSEITLARRVSPIAGLLQHLTELRFEAIASETEDFSSTTSLPMLSPIVVPSLPQTVTTSPRMHSPMSPASESPSAYGASLQPRTRDSGLTENGSMTSSMLRSRLRFGRKDKQIPSPVLQPISATVSVDAMSFMAWSSDTASCFMISSQQWCPRVHATAIFLAVAGVKHFAVASQLEGSQDDEVSIHDSSSGRKFGNSIRIFERICSMSFSRDGKQLALGGEQYLHNYTLNGENWKSKEQTARQELPKRKENLEEPATIDSQCMSFSSDSSRLVIATRYHPSGEVRIGYYEDLPFVLRATAWSAAYQCKVAGDLGLSSILCYPNNHLVLLCASTNTSRTILYSLDFEQNKIDEVPVHNNSNQPMSDRIQSAAIMVDDAVFILLNDDNRLFVVRRSAQSWQSTPVKYYNSLLRERLSKRDERTSIAARDSSSAVLLWVKDSVPCYTLIKVQENGQVEIGRVSAITNNPWSSPPYMPT